MNRTSIDMSMVPSDPSFGEALLTLVNTGRIPESRVTESARRVLELKKKVGLLETPVPPLDSVLLEQVGSAADIEAARDMARASIVLLKNGQSEVAGKCCRGKPGASAESIRGSLQWLCSGWGKNICATGWGNFDDAATRAEFDIQSNAFYKQGLGTCDFAGQ